MIDCFKISINDRRDSVDRFYNLSNNIDIEIKSGIFDIQKLCIDSTVAKIYTIDRTFIFKDTLFENFNAVSIWNKKDGKLVEFFIKDLSYQSMSIVSLAYSKLFSIEGILLLKSREIKLNSIF